MGAKVGGWIGFGSVVQTLSRLVGPTDRRLREFILHRVVYEIKPRDQLREALLLAQAAKKATRHHGW